MTPKHNHHHHHHHQQQQQQQLSVCLWNAASIALQYYDVRVGSATYNATAVGFLTLTCWAAYLNAW